MVTSVFIYVIIDKAFPGLEKSQYTQHSMDYTMAIMLLVLTVFHFHVSWYSRNNQCWDKVGWWFMALNVVICRVIIPLISFSFAIYNMIEKSKGSNAYNILQMSHALTILFSGFQFCFYFKR